MDINNLSRDTVVDRTFTIIKKLGGGYTGVVYQAHDERNNRQVALKFLKKTDKDCEAKTKRFKEEYQMQLIGKSHPNIAGVYQFGFYEEHFYFASEFITGYNIFVTSCALSLDEKIRLFSQLFDGLDFIHRNGLLHLDIKAENVFVKKEGDRNVVKIVDFGIGAFTGGEIKPGGTPHYIAPEVALGQLNKIDARADLYSAAVLMFYCLSGSFPFVDRWGADGLQATAKIIEKEQPVEPLKNLVSDVPEYLNAIVTRLLARDTSERFYPNARAVVNSLLTNSSEGFGTGILRSYLRPIGNKHIGREEIQTALKNALAVLNTPSPPATTPSAGRRPSPPKGEGGVFYISGHFGLGKTHLLETLKGDVAILPESVYVSTILFPADELAIETWAGELQRELSDNSRSVLILADDFHNCNPEDKAGTTIQNIIDTIVERKKNPDLYEGIKPIMLVMAGESFENGQNMLREDEKDHERYDWSITVQKAKAATWELKPFSKAELLEYLRSTPALKDKEISEKWLEYLLWATSGFPADVVAHLEEKDISKMLFSLDGSLVAPFTVEPNMDEPSMNVTSLKWLPLPAKKRLQKQYSKLEPLEREVVNLMSVWNHRGVTRPITENDIIGFFFSPAIRQTINNLAEKSVIASELTFTHPYMQSVVYEQILQMDKEAIHDTIAGYLKNDVDGILLHKGYGSDRPKAVKALVMLAQKRVREAGNLKLAIELLKDALAKTGWQEMPKLTAFIHTLLIEYNTNAGKYAEAENVFNTAMAEVEKTFFIGMRIWKTQLYRRMIPAVIQGHKFEIAEKAIDEALKLLRPKDPINEVIIKNHHARIFYERFFCEGGDVELLKKAKREYQETRKIEAGICEENRSRILNNEAGYVSLALGGYADAVQELRQKLLRDKKEKNLFGEIATAVTIANTYQLLEDHKASEEFAQHALKLAKRTKQGKWLFAGHHILANVYHDAGNIDPAISEGDKCTALSASIEKITESLIQLWITIADCYKVKKDDSKAMLFIEAAVKAGVKGYHLMRAEVILGEIYYYKGDHETAQQHFGAASSIIKGMPPEITGKFTDKITKFTSNVDEPTIKKT